MAVKDHRLDPKITEAARAEFLEKGFQKASVHQIARRAGITTGALYTRYSGKDELFASLVVEPLKQAMEEPRPFDTLYIEAQESRDPEKILEVIRAEERFYLDMLFDHYDACVLLFCRSEGSRLEAALKAMMDRKTQATLEFLRELSGTRADLDGVGLIMNEQFNLYRQVLEKGYTREKAVQCMSQVERFMEAGWRALFEEIL